MRKLYAALVAMVMATVAGAETFQGRDFLLSDLRLDKSRPAPLVVMLHGALGNARKLKRNSQFDAAARKRGLVVVYANSDGPAWRDGRKSNDPTDVAYLAALIETLQADPRIEGRAAYVLGHSSGGGMAMRLACDRPDLVAGIGVVASKVPLDFPCTRGRAIRAVFVHGTADPIAPHDGRPKGSPLGGTMSAADTLSLYARRNACSQSTRVKRIDRKKNDGTSVVLRRYTGCRAPLTQALILGGGHGWPTGRGGKSAKLGRDSAEINAGEFILQTLAQ